MNSLWFAFASCTLVGSESVTASIDCSSGSPDVVGGVTSVSASECKLLCEENCVSVSTSDELEDCLTNSALKGCLYRVGNAREHSVRYCLNATSATVIVAKFAGEDLYEVGDGSDVQDVTVALELTDATLFKSCANKNAKIGLSTEPFEQSVCNYGGNPTISSAFSVSSNLMLFSVKEALNGLWGSKDDVVVMMELEDGACGTPVITDANAYFAMSYQSGYIDTSVCSEIQDCYSCKASGCHWCSWNGVVNTVLPDWLPDWDWVNSAKNGVNGKCGLNSALCKISAGSYDTCGAPTALSTSLLLGTALGTLFLTTI
ncbi:hypothetical protein GNI_098920 [Gregarina niphandrodes]|uniref:Transmembrane protein n=1 Tax=Gregarina niphandrodes TaxID=110365 RepID=A0A023B4P6_GRENI|nr:hypothetical protein GNI_098920 [Gregarina niphandrodes]EZG57177.1 hypothetical protein GNI_098920 [Gregarina niphandrodes]|eukprot:XP_011131082.1 hypothetical protein GNI_098920 [Gregarina niphandrodes]